MTSSGSDAHGPAEVPRIDAVVSVGEIILRTMPLLGRGPFVLGRAPDAAVPIDSALASRRHCSVELGPTSLRIVDTSTNGTLVNEEVVNQRSVEVDYGAVIQIGDHRITFGPSRPITDHAAAPTPLAAAGRRQEGAGGAGEDSAALRKDIHRRLLDHLDLAFADPKVLDDPSFRPRVVTALKRIVRELDARIPAGIDRDALIGDMTNEALGLGPLEQLLADPQVTEIMVVDEQTIYVERDGKLSRSEARFTDEERVRAIIERIITPLGRRIDESSPIVDARLKDGSRVNAIIKPLALRGSCITIRKFSKKPMTPRRLIELGTMSLAMSTFLARSVLVRKNIVISGGTGSGKTTLLNVLSSAIPNDERIVTIEDAAELQLSQPHVVSLETRPANMEGKGHYSIRDLVKNALRMRPDRIIVGECRGAEALDMLQAMNTGHDGSLTTTHANSAIEAVSRLETMALMAGLDLPQRAIREQIASSVDLIVQQSRLPDGGRKIVEIAEVVGLDERAELIVCPIFRFRRSNSASRSTVQGAFMQTGYLPSFVNDFVIADLVQPGESCL